MKLIYSRSWLKYVLLLVLTGITTVTYTNQNGPGAGYAGAPSEANCTSCHSGSPISSGSAYDAISLTGIPAAGYIPGNTYTVTLSGNAAATSKNGFQIIPLTASNAMAGSITAGTGTQTMTTGSKTYIGHTNAGTSQSSWSFSWTAPAVASGTVTFYTSYNATNSSNSSSGDAVYLKSFGFGVGNIPVATITSPANNTIVCLGDSVQFTGSATQNPTSYAWDFLGNVPQSSTLQNPKVPMTTAGFKTIRFRATNASGTSANATITIQVVAKPTAAITPSGSQVICGNDSLTLNASLGTGYTYLWTPGNQTSSSIKVGSAGSYRVKITNSNGCFSNSNIVTTTTAQKPVVSIQSNVSNVCSTDSFYVTASAGLNYYRFYINNVASDSGSSNIRAYKLSGGNYTMSVMANNGTCNSNKDSVAVSVQSKPAAPATNCGTSTVNSVTFLITGANAEISLDTMKTWQTLNGNQQHTISGLNANQSVLAYTRTGTTAPCNYSFATAKTCVAAACSPVSFTVSAPAKVCLAQPNGSTGNGIAKIKVTGSSATLPLYRFGNGAFSTADSFEMQIQPNNNTILVSVKDSAYPNCPSHDTTLHITGVANLLSGNTQLSVTPAVVCSNGSVGFTTNNISAAIQQLAFFGSGDSVPFATRTRAAGFNLPVTSIQQYNLKKGDAVWIAGVDTLYNCPNISAPYTINWADPVKALWSYTLSGLSIDLKDSTAGNISRDWIYGDGNKSANAPRTQSYTYATKGTYYVGIESTDTNACVYKDSTQINPVPLGINGVSVSTTQWKVYPNPALNNITLEWSNQLPAKVVISDSQGKIVWSGIRISGDEIYLEGLSSGLYFIHTDTGQEQARIKLFIE